MVKNTLNSNIFLQICKTITNYPLPRELQKRTSRLTLRFRSASTERQYGRHREPLSAIPLLSLPLAAVAALVSQWIAVPLQGAEEDNLDGAMKLETAVSVAVTVVLGVVTLGAAAETAPKVIKDT